VLIKYLFRMNQIKEKRIFLDIFYYLLTYFLFFLGIFLSHSIFFLNLFFHLDVNIGLISFILLIVGFLLFVTEIYLALSIEKQLNLYNFFAVLLMYFTYSQIWLGLVIYTMVKEVKRGILRQE